MAVATPPTHLNSDCVAQQSKACASLGVCIAVLSLRVGVKVRPRDYTTSAESQWRPQLLTHLNSDCVAQQSKACACLGVCIAVLCCVDHPVLADAWNANGVAGGSVAGGQALWGRGGRWVGGQVCACVCVWGGGQSDWIEKGPRGHSQL